MGVEAVAVATRPADSLGENARGQATAGGDRSAVDGDGDGLAEVGLGPHRRRRSRARRRSRTRGSLCPGPPGAQGQEPGQPVANGGDPDAGDRHHSRIGRPPGAADGQGIGSEIGIRTIGGTPGPTLADGRDRGPEDRGQTSLADIADIERRNTDVTEDAVGLVQIDLDRPTAPARATVGIGRFGLGAVLAAGAGQDPIEGVGGTAGAPPIPHQAHRGIVEDIGLAAGPAGRAPVLAAVTRQAAGGEGGDTPAPTAPATGAATVPMVTAALFWTWTTPPSPPVPPVPDWE